MAAGFLLAADAPHGGHRPPPKAAERFRIRECDPLKTFPSLLLSNQKPNKSVTHKHTQHIEQDAKAGAIKPVRRAGWKWAASLLHHEELRGLGVRAQVRV